MRRPVERKIGVLPIEKHMANVTELARSQKVSLKVVSLKFLYLTEID
jgi:hypothetical protein